MYAPNLVDLQNVETMKESYRVSLAIVFWLAVFCGVVYTAVVVLSDEDVSTMSRSEAYAEADALPMEDVGLDQDHLSYIGDVVAEHLERGTMPGAVVAVVRGGKLAYIEAFGYRTMEQSEPMTLDTRFDVASLTKPVVTATAIMQLVERGEVTLNQRVSSIVPDFEAWTEEGSRDSVHITIKHLLTHTSGLPAYVAVERLHRDYDEVGREQLLDHICHVERLSEPGLESRYSCLNYILLGAIVERITGESLASYAEANIFEPLGMRSSCFVPTEEQALECAPTSAFEATPQLMGVVHDPLAREAMDGISGNAGLFTTAEDLARYAMMLLSGGAVDGVRVLSPACCNLLFSTPEGEAYASRTLAWERLSSGFNGAGVLVAEGSTLYHTGATGTSIVIDQDHDLAIIILTNRTAGLGTGADIHNLRARINAIVSASLRD